MRFQSPVERRTKIANIAIGTIFSRVVNTDGVYGSNAINNIALNQKIASTVLSAVESFATVVIPR